MAGWEEVSEVDGAHVAHGDCVALDAVGGGCGHSRGVGMEVLSVWPPSRPMSHRSWAPPELLY